MHRILALLVLLALSALGADFHVDSSASGANDGSSQADAWETLGDIVWGSINPGDVIYSYPGTGSTYGTLSINASGNATTIAGRIWIVKGGAGNRPIFDRITTTGEEDFIGLVDLEIDGSAISDDGIDPEDDADGWFVSDCYIHDVAGSGIRNPTGSTPFLNDDWVIRGNTLEDIGDIIAPINIGNYVLIWGDNTVVEYNSFVGQGADRVRTFGLKALIRNNYGGPMTDEGPSGNNDHVDFYQTWDDNGDVGEVFVEANFQHNNNDTNSHGWNIQDANDSGGLDHFVFCRNVESQTGGIVGEFQNVDNTWGFSNTYVEFYWSARPLTFQDGAIWFRATSDSGTWANNIFYDSNDTDGDPIEGAEATGVTAQSSSAFLAGTFSEGSGHVYTDPSFTDKANQDFMPDSGSPVRNAATALTTSSNTGSSSTSLTVGESHWFQGAVKSTGGQILGSGMFIRIGSGPWIKIDSVDYGTDTITLDTADTWSAGEDIEVRGANVDFGAIPYSATGWAITGTISNVGSDYTVTADNADAVRMVVFYEDGIPKDPDYDAPFQYTSGGGTVTANLYAYYASSNPIEQANLITSGTLTTTTLTVGP